jgi:GT2 family glycosyltransferase
MSGPSGVPAVDVLIPTFRRPTALAVTLASLVGQTHPAFRVVVSSQSPEEEPIFAAEADAVARVLRIQGRPVETHRHLPRRGLAEHRQSLLDRVEAPLALFLDDDVILEPDLIDRLVRAIRGSGAGFVGSAVVGLGFDGDVRPHEQAIDFWEGRVEPEAIDPDSPEWARHRLHNAANLHHLRQRLHPVEDRLYRVAWIGGCVLFDTRCLRAVGGFGFWTQLPTDHAGEDVEAQLRVQARFGGAGLFPSGAYHQELPTTVPDRRVDVPHVMRRSA